MNAQWRLFVAALQFVTHGPVPARAATRLVPLAGIVVGVAGAFVYWLGAQLWPTNVALVLAMLATADARVAGGAALYRVFFLLIKDNALMALSAAKVPFALPEYLTLGLIMIAGQAARWRRGNTSRAAFNSWPVESSRVPLSGLENTNTPTKDADKKVHTEDYQETDVWFKTEGDWKIAHVHYSAVPKPAKH